MKRERLQQTFTRSGHSSELNCAKTLCDTLCSNDLSTTHGNPLQRWLSLSVVCTGSLGVPPPLLPLPLARTFWLWVTGDHQALNCPALLREFSENLLGPEHPDSWLQHSFDVWSPTFCCFVQPHSNDKYFYPVVRMQKTSNSTGLELHDSPRRHMEMRSQ